MSKRKEVTQPTAPHTPSPGSTVKSKKAKLSAEDLKAAEKLKKTAADVEAKRKTAAEEVPVVLR
jgi:hypothetical protein